MRGLSHLPKKSAPQEILLFIAKCFISNQDLTGKSIFHSFIDCSTALSFIKNKDIFGVTVNIDTLHTKKCHESDAITKKKKTFCYRG